MRNRFELDMTGNGEVRVIGDEGDDRELLATDPNWNATDAADHRRDQRLHGPRRDLALGLQTVEEAEAARRGR